MALSKFDMLVKQNEEVPNDELTKIIGYCNKIKENGRDFNVNISLHLNLHKGVDIDDPLRDLVDPFRELEVSVAPKSPLDEPWYIWLDAEKFPILTEWAEQQSSFKRQIEYTITILQTNIKDRERMINKIEAQWLKPLLADEKDKAKARKG